MNEIKLIKNGDSTYSCDVPISREDWSAILSDKKVTTDAAINTLLSFYFMPEQRSSCSDLEKIYGRKSGYYLGAINQFCRKVLKLIGTFTIADHDSNGEIYWPVAMACGRVEKGLFVWQLRKELTEALRDRVIDWYISRYVAELPTFWKDEKYKWEAAECFANKWDIDAENFGGMFAEATAKVNNLLSSTNSFPRDMILNFAKVDGEFTRGLVRELYDESRPVEERFKEFMDASAKFFTANFDSKDRNNFQSTNAISTYLWLRYPDKYPIYKYRIYRRVSDAANMGVAIAPTGRVEEVMKGYEMYSRIRARLEKSDPLKISSNCRDMPVTKECSNALASTLPTRIRYL